MKKVYQKPEFQIIVQDQANAKFFVASFMMPANTTQNHNDGESYPEDVTKSQVSSYGSDQSGFEF